MTKRKVEHGDKPKRKTKTDLLKDKLADALVNLMASEGDEPRKHDPESKRVWRQAQAALDAYNEA